MRVYIQAITAGCIAGCSQTIAQKVGGAKRLDYRRIALVFVRIYDDFAFFFINDSVFPPPKFEYVDVHACMYVRMPVPIYVWLCCDVQKFEWVCRCSYILWIECGHVCINVHRVMCRLKKITKICLGLFKRLEDVVTIVLLCSSMDSCMLDLLDTFYTNLWTIFSSANKMAPP